MKMNRTGWLLVTALVAACDPAPQTGTDPGTLTVALQTTGASGTVYGLDATLDLAGPETRQLSLYHTDATYQVDVQSGTYAATLSNYTLYIIEESGASTPVDEAELLSPNPTGVAVPGGGTATLVLTFKTHGEEITFAEGTLEIELETIESSYWGTETPIGSSSGRAFPDVAVDAAGNAIVVWSDSDVHATRYDAVADTWDTETLIGSGSYPRVAVDVLGNAIVVWIDSIDDHVHAARYNAVAGTWDADIRIDSGSGSDSYYAVAVDAVGNATVVWSRHDGGIFSRIHAARYDASANTWGAEVCIDSSSDGATHPEVAMDAVGNATVVWHQSDSDYTPHIYTARYDAAADTWGADTRIDSGAGDANEPRVAVDAAGNATVVWFQSDGSGIHQIRAARYDAATDTWGADTRINSGSNSAFVARVAVDVLGNATVVWFQSDSSNISQIHAVRYDAAADTWGADTRIDSSAGDASFPEVAMDAVGNATVVWSQFDSSSVSNIYAARFDVAANTWGADGVIESYSENLEYPEVASTESGISVAVWRQGDSIMANRYY